MAQRLVHGHIKGKRTWAGDPGQDHMRADAATPTPLGQFRFKYTDTTVCSDKGQAARGCISVPEKAVSR
ncbi:hypothetical protein GCM10007385_30650 [Tateyamaria omphalii]|nr:hypothetical protein GCM10007385_30650 [Tateyamaria omphalii]